MPSLSISPAARPAVSPLVLIIRDGWGENPHPDHAAFNAVEIARSRGLLPTDDRLRREFPGTLIKTCGEDVGLPEGTMGNSEVGHQNIGAGRVVDQESVTITKACRAGLEHNAVVREAIERCIHSGENGRNLHLLGICSDAGVHGRLEHLYAVLRACKALRLDGSRVFLHLFTDGRDTGPFTGLTYIHQVEEQCRAIGVGRIASIVGRFYAMDRDHRWERVRQAYDLLTGYAENIPVFASAQAAVQDYYDHPSNDLQRGDEFVTPRVVQASEPGRVAPACVQASRIRSGDSVLFYNYRGDRPRELCAAFVFPDNQWASVKPSPDTGTIGFDRHQRLDTHFVIMTAYWEDLIPYCPIAFPKPPKMVNIAGQYISSLSLRQFRCAETEKYPHVTFFFNDYRDDPFPGERRENPQSPRVTTYDQQPEMSAAAVRDAVLARLASPDCEEFIVVNFANGDMVGHTGVLEAAVQACATVDQCVGAIIDATLARNGALIITADHGNCEQMFDPATNSPHTAHTVYDVPLHVVPPHHWRSQHGLALRGDFDRRGWFDPAVREQRGRLADIVPTALDLMAIAQPPEMTGRSLLL